MALDAVPLLTDFRVRLWRILESAANRPLLDKFRGRYKLDGTQPADDGRLPMEFAPPIKDLPGIAIVYDRAESLPELSTNVGDGISLAYRVTVWTPFNRQGLAESLWEELEDAFYNTAAEGSADRKRPAWKGEDESAAGVRHRATDFDVDLPAVTTPRIEGNNPDSPICCRFDFFVRFKVERTPRKIV